jgi:hypothetical protein
MALFLLKNLLLLAVCFLAFCPYWLAFWNFQCKANVKRRDLASLLSEHKILKKYQKRFPSKKDLNTADEIAKDIFATYFSLGEYIVALVFILVTVSAAVIYGSARIGIPPPFLGDTLSAQIKSAAWGDAVFWALMGSYLWNCYDLIREVATFDLRPDVLTRMWLKFWVAAAVAAIFSGGVTVGLQSTLGFAVGLVSIPALFGAISDKASKILSIKTTEGDTATQIKALQGASPAVIDTLADIDIQNTVELAYCDPMHVLMSTNMALAVIVDLIDQALLFNYMGADVAKIRGGGYRGSIEVATVGQNLRGDDDERKVAKQSVTDLTAMLGWKDQKVLDLVETLYQDLQVNLLWEFWGGASK